MTAFIQRVRALLAAATPGESFIDVLESDGCDVWLFGRTYKIRLACERGDAEYKQAERDAELLIKAPTDLSLALEMLTVMREALDACANQATKLALTEREWDELVGVISKARNTCDRLAERG